MKQQEILFFLGSIVIVVIAWIIFTVVHNSLTSTISAEVSAAIIPIQPSFNINVINKMKAKHVVVPADTIVPPSQTAIVVTTAPQVATSSGQTASIGGTLK